MLIHFTAPAHNPHNPNITYLDQVRRFLRKQRANEFYAGSYISLNYIRHDDHYRRELSEAISYYLIGTGPSTLQRGKKRITQDAIFAVTRGLLDTYANPKDPKPIISLNLGVVVSQLIQVNEATKKEEMAYTLNVVLYDAISSQNPLATLEDDQSIVAFVAFPL